MALPTMDSDPTALGLPLTPASTIAEAWAYLRNTGQRVAVVTRQGEPVGLVGVGTLLDHLHAGQGGDPVATVVEYVAVPVDESATMGSTLRQFRKAAWDWLCR